MTIKEIDAILEEGNSLKSIAQSYSEIANLKIKKIRNEVERNRIFFEEISKIYDIVKAFAVQKKINITKPKKRLCILLTSNYRFYGSINSDLIKYFVGSTRELTEVDKLIIGKAGVDYFKSAKVLPNYQNLLLKGDMPDAQELLDLAKLSADYSQVQVFHSKFKSLLRQQATFTDISALSFYLEEKVKTIEEKKTDNFLKFIFEPELAKILHFFETQVLTLLLEESFLESELSRTASRFITMDSAETSANSFIKEYETLKAYGKRNMVNNTILENFASMAIMRKEDN